VEDDTGDLRTFTPLSTDHTNRICFLSTN